MIAHNDEDRFEMRDLLGDILREHLAPIVWVVCGGPRSEDEYWKLYKEIQGESKAPLPEFQAMQVQNTWELVSNVPDTVRQWCEKEKEKKVNQERAAEGQQQ